MAGRHICDEIAAGQDVAPEAILVDRSGEKGGDPDHGNGLVFWVSLHALRVTARRPGARSIGEKPAKDPPRLMRERGREDATHHLELPGAAIFQVDLPPKTRRQYLVPGPARRREGS